MIRYIYQLSYQINKFQSYRKEGRNGKMLTGLKSIFSEKFNKELK